MPNYSLRIIPCSCLSVSRTGVSLPETIHIVAGYSAALPLQETQSQPVITRSEAQSPDGPMAHQERPNRALGSAVPLQFPPDD